ncbi:DUF2577 domain-containing protein [Clostridiaceae bacterium]|nr:DUF2577 domain-containing protein [Clostridiaceae bacterium]
MPDFIEVIQQTIQNAVEAMKLTDKATGTVESASPLKIKVDTTMQSIPEAGLILTDTVKERTVNVQGGSGSVAVREGLKPGDRVLMLRVQNGNQYIILSKIT